MAGELPENPTTDDLRLSFYIQLKKRRAREAQNILSAHPELANTSLPPTDELALTALDRMQEFATELEKGVDGSYDRAVPKDRRKEYLAAAAKLPDMLQAATPSEGKMLIRYDPTNDPDLTSTPLATAAMRVGVSCVYTLFEVGQTEEALALLKQLADYAVCTSPGPLLIGQLCYGLNIWIVYAKAVLPLARRGIIPADMLGELGDPSHLEKFDALQVLRSEYSIMCNSMARAGSLRSQIDSEVARLLVTDHFEDYGATSLREWLDALSGISDNWGVMFSRLRELEASGLDLVDRDSAEQFFATAYGSEIEQFWDQANALAQIAAATVEAQGLLLAVRMYSRRSSAPDTWLDEARKLSYPMLQVTVGESGTEISADMSHPTVKHGWVTTDVIASVP